MDDQTDNPMGTQMGEMDNRLVIFVVVYFQ